MIFEKIYNSIKSAVDAYDALVGKVNPDKPMIAVVMPKQDAISLMNFLGSCEICKSTEMVDKELLDYLYDDDLENNYVKKNIAAKLSTFLLNNDKILFKKREDPTRHLICYDSYILVGNVKEALKPMWEENKK